MKKDIVDNYLHSTGYLPPRNEEEMITFEKIFSKVRVREDFHVDVDSIVNGNCYCHHTEQDSKSDINGGISDADLRMAARNFEKMPADLIAKIKNQHKKNVD